MRFNHIILVTFILSIFNITATADRRTPPLLPLNQIESLDLSPEQILQEFALQDSWNIMNGSPNIVGRPGSNEEVIIEIYKAPRGFGINKEFLTVTFNGELKYAFLASTAREGKSTPTGSWRSLERMHETWTSTIYNVRMDFALFFSGPFAVHSTSLSSYHLLGKPASAGCIRLARPNARNLFRLVQRTGVRNLKVIIYSSGAQPPHSLIRSIEEKLIEDENQIRQLIRSGKDG